MIPSDDHGQRLLKGIERGSVEDFGEFYDLYFTLVYRTCLHVTKNPPEAEDVCHDVFVEIWRKAGTYDANRGSVKAWLLVKARTRCLDYIRKNRRTVTREPAEYADQGQEAGDPTLSAALRRIESEALDRALNTLPDRQRVAIVASFFKGHSHREISRQMKSPLGTVKSMIRYGMNRLKDEILHSGLSGNKKGGGQS